MTREPASQTAVSQTAESKTAVRRKTAHRTTAHRTTVYRHRVRYFEADQQGVVFNMWYLGYFDEAMSLFLEEGGLPYQAMLGSGHDVQLVHSEIDWLDPLHWPDEAAVEVSVDKIGSTSFTLAFVVTKPERVTVATGLTVYVVVATDGSGKRPIPPELAAALGPPPPSWPEGERPDRPAKGSR